MTRLRPAVSARDLSPELLARCGPDSPLHQLAKRRRPSRDLEHKMQVEVFAWAEQTVHAYPALTWLFAVPNWFGVKTAKQGARAKAEGRKAGVPDLWLPVARLGYHGLVIELKAGKNQPTPAQVTWLRGLEANGYRIAVCRSSEAAIDHLREYVQ